MSTSWLPALVVACAVFVAAWGTGLVMDRSRGESRTKHALGMIAGSWSMAADPTLTERDTQRSSVIPVAVGRFLVRGRARTSLERLLGRAGRSSSRDVDVVVGNKIGLAIIGLILGLVAGFLGGGAWWLTPIVLAAGLFWVPDLRLRSRAHERNAGIRSGLPDALDLMDMCVQAGLGLQSAIARVAATHSGPVAEEFGRVLRETQLGRPRIEALNDMARRCDEPSLTRVVGAIAQADRLGIPIAAVLRELAHDMRNARASAAREQAQKLPVKLLAPLMACFMPALFVVIVGPAAFRIAQALFGTG